MVHGLWTGLVTACVRASCFSIVVGCASLARCSVGRSRLGRCSCGRWCRVPPGSWIVASLVVGLLCLGGRDVSLRFGCGLALALAVGPVGGSSLVLSIVGSSVLVTGCGFVVVGPLVGLSAVSLSIGFGIGSSDLSSGFSFVDLLIGFVVGSFEGSSLGASSGLGRPFEVCVSPHSCIAAAAHLCCLWVSAEFGSVVVESMSHFLHS